MEKEKNKNLETKKFENKTYGLFKFHFPTEIERKSALDLSGESTLLKKLILTDLNSFYSPIKPPNENKKININNFWLLSHKEFGETFTEFLRNGNFYKLTKNNDIIYLFNLVFVPEEEKNDVIKEEKNEDENDNNNNEINNENNINTNNENNNNENNNNENNNNENNNNIKNSNLTESDKKIIINIPPSIPQKYLDKFQQILSSYFSTNIKFNLQNLIVPLTKIIYKKNDETNDLISIQADYLIKYLNSIIFNKKNKEYNNAYSYVFFTNIPLFHNISLYKEGKINKYQFYPKNFLDNDSCFELININKRTCLMSFSQFLIEFKNNKNNKENNNNNNENNNENNNNNENKETELDCINFKRSLKLLIRNICILFGVNNCIYYNCVLNGFSSLNEFDNNSFELCPICLRKIFNIILRKFDDESEYEKNLKNTIILFDRLNELKNILSFDDENKNEKNEENNNNEFNDNNNNNNENQKNFMKKVFKSECNWYKKRSEILQKFFEKKK